MSTVNFEVKGQLAKLLATEDLIIENRNVSTASFDVVKRVLTLPLWEKASGTVYDMLVGHEVGHALFTPPDNWKERYPDVPKSFVNVLEDVRIERLMKRKYPGINKSFYSGYSEMLDQDFFGIEGDDPEDLKLIDKINLYYKVGNLIDIPFTVGESIYVRRAAEAETFEDILNLAKDVAEYSKAHDNTNTKNTHTPVPVDSSQDSEGEGEQEEDNSFSDSELENSSIENEAERPDPQEQTAIDDTEDQFEPQGGETGDDFESLTDKNLEENIEKLAGDSQHSDFAYVEVPQINLDTVIGKNEEIHEYLENHYVDTLKQWNEPESKYGYYSTQTDDPFREVDSEYADFRKSAQKEVNYLVKEFECKKSADAYARSATARTGVLDTSVLHQYKFSEDIFKKITVVPDGKNHGLIFILDWSGSMSEVLLDTVKQLYNLVWFCKKVSIPFEVYAFSNQWNCPLPDWDNLLESGYPKTIYPKPHVERKSHELFIDDDFSLMNLLTSRVKGKKLENQLANLYRLAYSMDMSKRYTCHYQYPTRLSLSGTPLNEALICLNQVLPKFQKENNLQKVQCIVLTDGEAAPARYSVDLKHRYNPDEVYSGMRQCTWKRTFLRDRPTGKVYQFGGPDYSGITETLLRQLRGRFPYSNFVGIRVLAPKEVNNFIRRSTNWDYDKIGKYTAQWKKDKTISLLDTGYHTYFGLSSNNLNSDTEFEVKEDATKAQIRSAFKKSLRSKKMNKKVLGEFVSLIV